MLDVRGFLDVIDALFPEGMLRQWESEWGFTLHPILAMDRIGYCTNLNQETVEEAIKKEVSLLVTHHDAWDFLYGLKETCLERLASFGIGHFFSHLPLDAVDFGTSASLLERLGFSTILPTHEDGGIFLGRLGVYEEPKSLTSFVSLVEEVLGEPIQVFKNGSDEVKRVGVVTGGGGMTMDLQEVANRGCDLYLTGERNLYTLEYANYLGINLVVGSHTFTELFGVESLVKKIKERVPETELVLIEESHLEASVLPKRIKI